MNPVQLVASLVLLTLALALDSALSTISTQLQKTSEQDLIVSGDLPGAPSGSTRYIPRSEIEKLHHVSATVTDDPNFTGPARIEGVLLEDLLVALHIPEQNTLIAAICDDQYETHFTADYRAAHHPVLVFNLNGKPLAVSSRNADEGVYGPYLISHAVFTPRYNILSKQEESQIPNGLQELRFLKEDKVLAAIQPQGSFADDSPVEQGYRIAREDCFRCHNQGEYGGHKANRTWQRLAKVAKEEPDFFAAYIRDPKSQYALAQMPGEPKDSDAAIKALTAYFQTFAPIASTASGAAQ